MTTLKEPAWEAALSAARSGRNQTLLFYGAKKHDVVQNLHHAVKFIAGKTVGHAESKLQILQILHQKIKGKDEVGGVPYRFHFLREGYLEQLQLEVVSFFEYSDELLLPAALLFGSPSEFSNSMRIQDVKSSKINIKMDRQQLSAYKEVFASVQKAFAELNIDANFLWSATAAILHIQSGNLNTAESLMGAEKGSLEKILNEEKARKEILCNALFHTTSMMILDAIYGIVSPKLKNTTILSLIGVTEEYSLQETWNDFLVDYQNHNFQLYLSPHKATAPVLNTSRNTEAKMTLSFIRDFVVEKLFFYLFLFFLFIFLKIFRKLNKVVNKYEVHETPEINKYGEIVTQLNAKFIAVSYSIRKMLTNKKWKKAFPMNERGESVVGLLEWSLLLKRIEQGKSALEKSQISTFYCTEMKASDENKILFCATPDICLLCIKKQKSNILMQLKKFTKNEEKEKIDLKSQTKKIILEMIKVNFLGQHNFQLLTARVREIELLDSVMISIACKLEIELSQLDKNYIIRKYIKTCLDVWLADALKMCEKVNKVNYQSFLDALDQFSNLTEGVPPEFSGSKYFELLQSIKLKIPEHRKNEYLRKFKCEFELHLLMINESVKRELEFIATFVKFLRSFKDIQTLANTYKLQEFCSEKISFGEFQTHFLRRQIASEHSSVFEKIRLLKDETEFTQMEKLKKFIKKYIEPYKLTAVLNDKHYHLEIKSMILELEKVKSELRKHISTNTSINEIRLIVGDTLYLDADLESSWCHGINVIIFCPRVIVHNKIVTIDVSGKDCDHIYSGTAEQIKDGAGKDGEYGFPGESGGNIVFITNELVHGNNLLVLVSNGGKGGTGQDGANGADGEHGVGLKHADLKKDYDSPVKFLDLTNTRVKNFIQFLKDQTDQVIVDEPNRGRSHFFKMKTESGMEITYNHDQWLELWNVTRSGVFLCKGSFGKPGALGGMNGLGGEGGFGGEIDAGNESEIVKKSNKGKDGAAGNCGINGKPGRNGWDMGYVDFSYWPKADYSGTNEQKKLKIETYSGNANDRTWCSHYKSYINIVDTGSAKLRSYTMERRQVATSRKTRQAYASAVKQKMVSKENVMSSYKSFLDTSSKFLESMQLRTSLGIVNENAQALHEQKVEETEEEQLNIKVQRDLTYESAKYASKVVVDRTFDNLKNMKIFDSQQRFRKECIPDLENIRIKDNEVKQLLCFVSSKQFQERSSFLDDEKLKMTRLANFHYQIIVLNSLNLHIEKYFSSPKTEKIYVNVNRYLYVSNKRSTISEQSLNMIDNFILDDDHLQRKTIINHISQAINAPTKLIQSSLHAFFTQDGDKQMDETSRTVYNSKFKEYITFNINKKMQIQFHRREFEELAQKFPLLFENWKKTEAGEMERIEFDNEVSKLLEMKENNYARNIKEKIKLQKSYEAIHKTIDSRFDWTLCTGDKTFMDLFFQQILLNGLRLKSYWQLLSELFSVRLNLHSINEDGEIGLIESYSLEQSRELNVLRVNQDVFKLLGINENYMEMENERYLKGKIYNQLICAFDDKKSKADIDAFEKDFPLKEWHQMWNEKISLCCCCEQRDLLSISEQPAFLKSKLNIRKALNGLSSDCIPNNVIPHLLATRFNCEACNISDQELIFLINQTFKTHLKNTEEIPHIQWIISTAPQSSWTAELTLLHLQNYFKSKIASLPSIRESVMKMENRELLLLLNIELENSSHENPVQLDSIENLFELLKDIKIIPHQLYETNLSNWLYVLECAYWYGKLHTFFKKDSEENLCTATYYLQTLDNMHGKKQLDLFLNRLHGIDKIITSKMVTEILMHFVSGDWILNNKCIEELKAVDSKKTLLTWKQKMCRIDSTSHKGRSMSALMEIIKADSNASNTTKSILTGLEDELASKKTKDSIAEIKTIHDLSKLIIRTPIKNSLKTTLDVLAKIDQCIFLKRRFYLRDTQKLSIIMLLSESPSENNDCMKGRLLQVSTGEGKTLIVVAVAIIKALRGEKVDVITSSSVLAKRDALANKDIFECFGVTVHHNCNEKLQNRIKAYSSNNVIYGDISGFQRDYLLDRFYGKNILGDRNFQNILVDEVDSMLLDKGNNRLYLSHDLPWLDKLNSVYVYLWNWINQPTSTMEVQRQIEYIFDENILRERVLHDIFGLILKKDIWSLDSNLNDLDVDRIWNKLLEANVICPDGTLDKPCVNIKEILKAEESHIFDRFKFLLLEIENREKSITIPNYLKSYVKNNLDSWIKSSHNAFFMKERDNFIIDVNRSENNYEMSPNIIILDKDTGTDQTNSQWDKALHQFLQLKHGCRISAQSLKAVFISNVSYFKLYSNLYGLTGTLGSKQERKLLKEMHDTDFLTMPTAKPKRFKEYFPVACSDKGEWTSEVQKEAISHIKNTKKKRSVLIICETVEQVDMFKMQFKNAEIQALSYTRDYEDFDYSGEKKLGEGEIVISTNLAGRGTDIKISDTLIQNGGLHVILTFLPGNNRIEQQAYGRAARCGEPGSARLIFCTQNMENVHNSNVILMKKARDDEENHRLSEIKKNYEMSILAQEKCFQLFKDFYLSLKKKFGMNTSDKTHSNALTADDIILQSFLDEWAYWLDSNDEVFNKAKSNSDCQKIYKLAQAFIQNLSVRVTHKDMVNNNPAALIKLAKHYINTGELNKAIEIFDSVIENEPDFCEAALYYKAMAMGKLKGWGTESIEKDIFPLLKKSKRKFEKLSDMCYSQAAIIAQSKRTSNAKIVQIEAFEQQQTNIQSIYQVYIDSIDDVIGHAVTPAHFYNEKENNLLSNDLFEKLQDEGVISYSKINNVREDVRKICDLNGIKHIAMDGLLNKNVRKVNENDLLCSIKNLEYPSREKFWEILKTGRALKNEIKYLQFNLTELSKYDKDLIKQLKDKRSDTSLIQEKENYIWLLPIPEQKDKSDTESSLQEKENCNSTQEPLENELFYIQLEECLTIYQADVLEKLIKNNVAKENKMASIDRNILSKMSIEEYSSIKASHLEEISMTHEEADLVLEELVKQAFLVEKNGIYVLDGTTELQDIDFSPFLVYQYAIVSLLRRRLSYSLAVQTLEKSSKKTVMDMLPCNTHCSFLIELIEEQILIHPTVKYEEKLNFEKSEVKEFYKFLTEPMKDEENAKRIVDTLNRARSVLKSLECPEGKLDNVSNKLANCSTDVSILLNAFALNGLDDVIIFGEQRWSKKMLWNTLAVKIFGIIQIAIGLAIQLYTAGAMTWVGADFINEGIGDIMYGAGALFTGHFSWADYGRQKLISLGTTALNFGFATFFSRCAQVSRFGSKLFSAGDSAAGLVGRQLIDKVGTQTILLEFSKRVATEAIKGIAFGAVSAGVDGLVRNYLQQYCDGLAEKLLKDINQVINEHHINTLLEEAYRVLGPAKAKRFLEEQNREFFNETKVENKYARIFGNVANCFMRGMAEASTKTSSVGISGSQIVQTLKAVASYMNKAYKVIELRYVTDSLMSEMAEKLRAEIDKKMSEDSSEIQNQDDFEKFKLNITETWRKSVNKHVGDYIAQTVVTPILNQCGNFAVRCIGNAVKKCYKGFRNSDGEKKFTIKFTAGQKEDGSESKNELDEEISSQLQDENDQLQIEAMRITRDPDELAKNIREGAQMEMTCLLASVQILEEKTKEKVRLVVTDTNGTRVIESGKSSKGPVREIKINLHENHFTNADGKQVSIENLRENDCLFAALSSPLDMTPDSFREKIAKKIESDRSLRDHVRAGDHSEQINKGFYGGKQANKSEKWDDYKKLIQIKQDEDIKGGREPTNQESKCVIYMIKCIHCPDTIYIGSTNNLNERFPAHEASVEKYDPENPKTFKAILFHACEKHEGIKTFKECFTFKILEIMPPDTSPLGRRKAEQLHINEHTWLRSQNLRSRSRSRSLTQLRSRSAFIKNKILRSRSAIAFT